ncbi:MAG: Fe-S cluster assembly protein SufD [Pseudomonadota bacterium]
MSAGGTSHSANPDWPAGAEQQVAFQRYLDLGLPTQRDEAWRYAPTDEVAIALTALLTDPAGATRRSIALDITAALATALPDIALDRANTLVLINGRLTDHDTTANGWSIDSNRVTGHNDTSALGALNTACNDQTLALHVSDDSEPLNIVHIASATQPTLASPRLQITVPTNVAASVVEHLVQLDASAPTVINAALSITLQAGASLRWHRLQRLGGDTLSIYETHARLERDAKLEWFSLDTGAALARNHLQIALHGDQARADLSGVYVCSDQQVVDNRLAIRHAHPNASSSQEYAGIAGGSSRAIFHGKVRVDEGADGTVAKQRNRNLLMDNTAKIFTKPELEIYADEVECAHGATTGQIDPDAMFYLLARGIDPNQAKRMLVDAFVAASLTPINDTPLEPAVKQRLADKLAQLQAGVLA